MHRTVSGRVRRDATGNPGTDDRAFRARLFLFILPLWLLAAGAEAGEDRATTEYRRWAVLATEPLERTGLADLVTAKLSAQADMELVERQQFLAVVGEQQRSASLAGAAAGERLKLGNLLGAEAVVLLSGEKKGTGPICRNGPEGAPHKLDLSPFSHVKLVIADCRCGARLRVDLIACADDDLEEWAAVCVARIDQTRRHFAGGLRQVIGVTPFLSKSLTHDHDHLQAGYAYLLQSSLMSIPGVAVVEVEEGRAIGRERALAGADLEGRPVPLFVEGEYEVSLAPADVEPTLRLGVRVTDGKTVRMEFAREGLAPAEVPDLLRGPICAEIVRLFQKEPGPGLTRREQHAMLTQRARSFSRYGGHEQAVGLREAALLLEPDDLSTRIDVIGDYLRWHEARVRAAKTERGKMPDGRLAPVALPDAAIETFRATHLAHLQIVGNHIEYLMRRRMLNPREANGLIQEAIRMSGSTVPGGSPESVSAERAMRLRARKSLIWRLYPLLPRLDPALREGKQEVRAELAGPYSVLISPTFRGHDAYKVKALSPLRQYILWTGDAVRSIFSVPAWATAEAGLGDEWLDDLFRFVTEVAEGHVPLPGLAILAAHRDSALKRALAAGRLDPAAARGFFERLAEMGRPADTLHARLGMLALRMHGYGEPIGGEEARREIDALKALVRELDSGADGYSQIVAGFDTSLEQLKDLVRVDQQKGHPPPRNPVAESPARLRVRFEPIEATRPAWDGLKRCGPSLDVAWDRFAVFVIPEAWRVEKVFTVPPTKEPWGDAFRYRPSDDHVLEPVFDGGALWIPRRLSGVDVVSPAGEVLAHVGRDEGLPPHAPDLNLVLHPIEPGRCVVIGQYGRQQRVWFALVSRCVDDGSTRPRVEVFHVAGKRPDENDPFGIFHPAWLAECAAPGDRARRLLLVGRGDTNYVVRQSRIRPLAIDLKSLEVSVYPIALPTLSTDRVSDDRTRAVVPMSARAPRVLSLVEEHTTEPPPDDSYDPRSLPPWFYGTSMFRHQGAFYQLGQRWYRVDGRTFEVEEVERTTFIHQEPFNRYAVSAHHGLVGWAWKGRLYRAVIEPRPSADDDLAVRYRHVPAPARARHHAAVEAIRRLGASAGSRWGYRDQGYWQNTPVFNYPNDPIARRTPDEYQWRTIVYLSDAWRGGDAGLEHLADLHDLRDLYLVGAKITDAGLRTIGRMDTLESLYLVETGATSAGLAHLQGLHGLVYLRLEGTTGGGEFDASGLHALAGLPNLQRLTLYGAGFDDATFAALEKLPKLRRVALLNTAVTQPALQEFKKARRTVTFLQVKPSVAWTFFD